MLDDSLFYKKIKSTAGYTTKKKYLYIEKFGRHHLNHGLQGDPTSPF